MNPRSRFSLRRRSAGGLLAMLSLGWLSCTPPDGADLEAAEKALPGTKAGCEEATAALLNTNENMLPGRDCGSCHRAGGQASNSPFTVAGTVFSDFNAACNPGGVAGVYVEILDKDGAVQPMGRLRTNGVGNFTSAARYTTPLTVRVRQYDSQGPMNGMGVVVKENVMLLPQGQDAGGGRVPVNCATCHQFTGSGGLRGAEGRIYIK